MLSSSKSLLRKTCRIQYASDIHLEFQDKAVFPLIVKPAARLLVLAGDIGNPQKALYRSFLNWCHDKWDHIFVIAGNHEFYNHKPNRQWHHDRKSVVPWNIKLEMCKAICSEWPNVHFMEKNSIYLPEYNVEFLGTTLWSYIPTYKHGEAMEYINDYNYIAYNSEHTISPDDTNEKHEESVDWLNSQIYRCQEENKHVVVITHHLPTTNLGNPLYANDPMNCCFMTDLESMITPPIRAWISGHTHYAKEWNKVHEDGSQTVCGVNAYGYNMRERVPYSTEKVIEFPCGPFEEKDVMA